MSYILLMKYQIAVIRKCKVRFVVVVQFLIGLCDCTKVLTNEITIENWEITSCSMKL